MARTLRMPLCAFGGVALCLLLTGTSFGQATAPVKQDQATAPTEEDGAFFVSSDDVLFSQLDRIRTLLQKPVLNQAEQDSLTKTIADVRSELSKRKRRQESRFLGARGDVVEVYCLYESGRPSFQFAEKEREKRITSDLSVLLQAFFKASVSAGAAPQVSASYRGYILERERADLLVTVGKVQAKPAEPVDQAPLTAKRMAMVFDFGALAADAVALKAKLVTGGRESWFLSADILVDDASVLKFDSAKHVLVEREAPSEFHVGLNYSFGDVASSYPRSFRDAIFVKALFSASDEPLSSYGLGLGIRGVPLFRGSVDLSPLSIFAAYIWAEEDDVNAAGEALPGEGTSSEVRVGVSFNLSKVLDWIK